MSLATGLVFGLLPSMQLSKPSLTSILNESGRGGGHPRTVVRRGLVMVQLAFSVVLVFGAVLLLRSLLNSSASISGSTPSVC